ncbi:MAG: xanthine dehydrogenase molybdopterin binding subunit [Alphaproteobacteria bacterium]
MKSDANKDYKLKSEISGGVHKSVAHESAHLHVTGEAIYVDDMPELPNTLQGYILQSPYAYAKIKNIDYSEALKVNGVKAVMTAKDIPGVNDIGPILKNEPALAEDYAEYVGHPVAIIAANTIKAAKEASKLIKVDYEVLEPILTIEDALKKESFLTKPQVMARGDYEKALEKAKNRIQGQIQIGGQDHFYLETQISVAAPLEDGTFIIYISTQHPTEAQMGVSHVLGLPQNHITVEMRRMGGGFGGKESQPTIFAAFAALLAWKTKKPVKMRLNRDDDMVITGKRHDFLVKYDVGFDDNGRIEGIDLIYAAKSGIVADMSPPVVQRALCHSDNCYYLPDVRVQGFLCKTNTVSNTAFRGFGGPQGMIGIEACLEHIASYLKKDPILIRKANFYGKEERNVTPYGQKITDNIISEVFEDIEKTAEIVKRRQEIKEFNAKNDIIKKGLALFPLKFGISFNAVFLNQAGALIHVYRDGSILINQAGAEMGQGLLVKMMQVVAEIFQVDIENIRINATRTDKVPNTSATAASSDADMNGMAIKDAAYKIKTKMIDFAKEHFKTEKIVFKNNQVLAADTVMSFNEFTNLCYMNRVSMSSNGFYKTPKIYFDPVKMQGHPFYYFTYGTCATEVAIDTLTGETRVLRADILHDCGDSLNPAIDFGQVEGGYVQGLGWMTMEELWWDKEGRLRTHAPSTYKIPVSRDIPKEFNVRLLENSPNKEDTIFHSKATGEPPIMQAISVWLAIADAIASIGDYKFRAEIEPPATPEKILAAITRMKENVIRK